MKNLLVFVLLLFFVLNGLAQKEGSVTFNSNNQDLNTAFEWAKNKALSFAHDGTDPVGYWYEAALPNREAFCMRDVSHQTIGAEILGLSKHNFNMLLKFAENIVRKKTIARIGKLIAIINLHQLILKRIKISGTICPLILM